MSDMFRDGRSIEQWELEEHDAHFHTRERWFGLLGSQTATAWADAASLTPYVAISGSGDYGSDADDEAQVLGSADTPVLTGVSKFDARRIFITAFSATTVYMCRIVWGTGTLADAITAGQCSEFPATKPIATGLTQGIPEEIRCPRIASGTKVWVQCKNASDNATISFLFGIHEYDF